MPDLFVVVRARPRTAVLALLALSITLGGATCARIAPFSAVAYEKATSLKVDALEVMGRATESYTAHRQEIERLIAEVDKAYEYAQGRPDNELSTKQWAVLKDPELHLLGGFLRMWRTKGRLSQAFVDEAKGVVAEAFDEIIGLESGKLSPDDLDGGGSAGTDDGTDRAGGS